MGSRVQAGVERDISLRNRLLLATIAIVAVSLVMSGGITWWLVSQLVTNNVYQELDARLAIYVKAVNTSQGSCPDRILGPLGTPKCVSPYNQSTFLNVIAQRIAGTPLQGDRLVLLDGGDPPSAVLDSDGRLQAGETVSLPPGPEQLQAGIVPANRGTMNIGGREYLFSASHLNRGRFVQWVVVARRQDSVTAQTTARLDWLLLGAGSAGLVVAIVVSMVLARALTQPLRELQGAAEAIAAGDYSRRVVEAGPGEVGVVAKAFNRMAEAVERARKQQRAFLADVSHELKTPLTSLIGFSEAMVDGSLRTSEEERRAATIINEEAHRVLHMAQELLDLARVEAGQITYHTQPVDLGSELQQEAEVVRPRAERRQLQLRMTVPPNLPPIHADPDRLHQVLGNLIDNAVKYAPAGSEVEISAEAHPYWVVTEVCNKVGAHPPDPERIFDRFYRADPSRSSVAWGVGLGLAISRELATAQGGQLSAYLNGSRLHLRLAMPALGNGRAPGRDGRGARTSPGTRWTAGEGRDGSRVAPAGDHQ